MFNLSYSIIPHPIYMGLKLQGPSLLSNMFLRLIHLLTMIANTKQDSAKIYVFLAHYKMKYVYKQPPDIL